MKRDMDFIRDILIQTEKKDVGNGKWISFDFPAIDSVKLVEHLFLLEQAGILEGTNTTTLGHRDFKARRLTWAGHDLLESVRDEETWKNTKMGALQAGGWTIELLKDLAKGFAKVKIEAVTGIKL